MGKYHESVTSDRTIKSYTFKTSSGVPRPFRGSQGSRGQTAADPRLERVVHETSQVQILHYVLVFSLSIIISPLFHIHLFPLTRTASSG